VDEGQKYGESAVLLGLVALLILGVILVFPREVGELIATADAWLRHLVGR